MILIVANAITLTNCHIFVSFSAGLLADPSIFHTGVSDKSARDYYVYNGKTPRISIEA